MSLLAVQGLTVSYPTDDRGARRAITDVSFTIDEGETVGLSGPSGCGKTTIARALLALLPHRAHVAGSVRFDGAEVLGRSGRNLQPLRGAGISIVFQEPALALNPVMTVGTQIAEVVRAHGNHSRDDIRRRVLAALDEVGFGHDSGQIAGAYPHELSGGQRQRILIAQAIVCRPRLIVADEPTASLDAGARAGILQLIRELNERHGTAWLIISHSAEVLATAADRVLDMWDGRIVASTAARRVPPPQPAGWIRGAGPVAIGTPASALVEACAVRKTYGQRRFLWRRRRTTTALDGLDLQIRRGVTIGLSGDSGSGKSTLARCLAALETPDAGEVRIGGRRITGLRNRALVPYRNLVQLIVQDSAAALNPRFTAADIVAEPLEIQSIGRPGDRRRRALQLMEHVGLPADRADGRPGEFSGGERQRLALARALALQPSLLILDESFSGLDSLTRHHIVTLLRQLHTEREMSCLCISHDLTWLTQVTPHVVLMQHGRIVERLLGPYKGLPRIATGAAPGVGSQGRGLTLISPERQVVGA